MLTSLRTRLPIVLAVAALLAVPAAAAPTPGLTGSEGALLAAINQARTSHGLRALVLDRTLARAARAHTLDMVRRDYFAHGAFEERMLAFGVPGPFAGENLAWGNGSLGSARGIVAAWLASPEHRANLLRPGFRRIGLGEATSTFLGASDANVVTADFAGF